jgi:glycosyltransferase involved in cell wall biosynthesis
MGLGHDFATVGAAMAELGDEVHWLFIGDGPRKSELERRARESGAPHVTFLDYLPPDQLALGLTAADVHLITLEPALAGLLAPSKLYGVLAAGRPIAWVGPDDGRVAELVRDHGIGISVRNGDGRGLADGLRKLRNERSFRTERQTNSRMLHETRFARSGALRRHVELLEQTCSR